MNPIRRLFCLSLGLLPFLPFLKEQVVPVTKSVLPLQSPVLFLKDEPGIYCLNIITFATNNRCTLDLTRYDKETKKSVYVWLGAMRCDAGFEEALHFIDRFRSHSKIRVVVAGKVDAQAFLQEASNRGCNVTWHI
jgi:hypothetical protein